MSDSLFNLFSLLALGFVFGIKHAFDADHLAAISVITARSNGKRDALKRGVLWGIGHTAALLAVGVLILILKIQIPPSFNQALEYFISFVLIMLGLHACYTFFASRKMKENVISHTHPPFGSHHHPYSFFMGLVHGLAGSAALIVVVVSTLSSAWRGLLYIVIFGAGSMVGMALFSLFINLFRQKFQNGATLITGIISLVVGVHYMLTYMPPL